MEHVNGCCFRGIYKGGLWENDLHVSAHVGNKSIDKVLGITLLGRTKPLNNSKKIQSKSGHTKVYIAPVFDFLISGTNTLIIKV